MGVLLCWMKCWQLGFMVGRVWNLNSLSALVLKWWWRPWAWLSSLHFTWLSDFWEGHSSKARQWLPSLCMEKTGTTYLYFILKYAEILFFMQNQVLLHFVAASPGWIAGGNDINSLGIFQIYNLSLQWFTALTIPTAEVESRLKNSA